MTRQLTIFDTGHVCSICLQDPGRDRGIQWNGFWDANTRQLICWPCRDHHYKLKAANGLPGLYSEMPVPLIEREGQTLAIPLIYLSR